MGLRHEMRSDSETKHPLNHGNILSPSVSNLGVGTMVTPTALPFTATRREGS
jgi:hypothetical protein